MPPHTLLNQYLGHVGAAHRQPQVHVRRHLMARPLTIEAGLQVIWFIMEPRVAVDSFGATDRAGEDLEHFK